MVPPVGAKTVRFGTVIMPNVVKGILGALPQKALIGPTRVSVLDPKLSYHKNIQFPEGAFCADGRYPSVSTILGCTTSQRLLYQWQLKMIKQLGGVGAFRRYMRTRFLTGTQYHSCIRKILQEFKHRDSFPEDVVEQVTSEVDVSVAVYLNSIIPFLRLLGNEDMEVERRTGHNGLCYCGRFDAAVRYRDALFLMDWKTASPGSTKDDHAKIEKMYNDPLQVAAYVGAVNSDPFFKDLPEIRYGAVVIARENGSVPDVVEMNALDLELYWNKWLDCVRQFWTEMETRPAVNGVISFVWNGENTGDGSAIVDANE